MELVSIITPVFNRAKDLLKTIQSVCYQTYAHWELILVDDGSTDESVAIAARFAAKDPRIVSIERDRLPKGAPTCRNIGIKMAKGKFMMFLDSDDLLAPRCLENRLDLINEEDFIVTQTGIIRNDSPLVKKLWSSLKHEDDLAAFTKLEGWCISSTFFKTEFVKKYTFDEEASALQDWGFHLNILLDKPKYSKYPDSQSDVYVRSGHGGQRISINTNNHVRIKNRFNTFLKVENRLKEKGLNELSYSLIKQYLKHLNFAVLNFGKNEFQELLVLWKRSKCYQNRSGRLVRLYLETQRLLRITGFRFLHGINYRLHSMLLLRSLFEHNQREFILSEPFEVESEIEQLLESVKNVKS